MTCREPLLGAKYTDEDLVAMLLGYQPLPWEANPNMMFQAVHSSPACRVIRHLLRSVHCASWTITSESLHARHLMLSAAQ